tara:strand:+ start:239 stop:1114 length:876 start_codon:yes stop_codon:yes gene_type:complete
MFYFIFFVVLFIVAVPTVIFFAMGYRFDFTQNLVSERGGLYVFSQVPGTEIYVNDEFVEETGIFNREYDTQSLVPDIYTVRVYHDDYLPWEKRVMIEPQQVTSLYPFLFPQEITWQEITPMATSTSDMGTTTEIEMIPNEKYDELVSLFDIEEEKDVIQDTRATSTQDVEAEILTRVFGDIEVWHDENSFYARWTGRGDWMPSYFCEDECQNPLVFLMTDSPVTNFEFYPGRDDVVIYSVEQGGVYVVEVDKREIQTHITLREGNGIEFMLLDNNIVIREGEYIATLDLSY